jgi:predicted CDP-diglyceride synthetase/phosphatidate cytidylyltransferase
MIEKAYWGSIIIIKLDIMCSGLKKQTSFIILISIIKLKCSEYQNVKSTKAFDQALLSWLWLRMLFSTKVLPSWLLKDDRQKIILKELLSKDHYPFLTSYQKCALQVGHKKTKANFHLIIVARSCTSFLYPSC